MQIGLSVSLSGKELEELECFRCLGSSGRKGEYLPISIYYKNLPIVTVNALFPSKRRWNDRVKVVVPGPEYSGK